MLGGLSQRRESTDDEAVGVLRPRLRMAAFHNATAAFYCYFFVSLHLFKHLLFPAIIFIGSAVSVSLRPFSSVSPAVF